MDPCSDKSAQISKILSGQNGREGGGVGFRKFLGSNIYGDYPGSSAGLDYKLCLHMDMVTCFNYVQYVLNKYHWPGHPNNGGSKKKGSLRHKIKHFFYFYLSCCRWQWLETNAMNHDVYHDALTKAVASKFQDYYPGLSYCVLWISVTKPKMDH